MCVCVCVYVCGEREREREREREEFITKELARMILEAEKSHDLLSGVCKLEPQESQWCNYHLSPKA